MLNRPHMYLGVLEDANVLLPRENGRGWLKCRAGAVIQHSCVLWRLTIRNILTSTYDFQRSRQCSRMPVCTHVHVDHTSIQNPVHLFVGCHQSSVPPLYRMVCHIFCSFFPFFSLSPGKDSPSSPGGFADVLLSASAPSEYAVPGNTTALHYACR